MLRQAGLEVRFDPACVLASRVDFNWRGMFAFVRRQYCILRHYAFRWWLLALAAATVANAAWLASLGWLASAVWMQSSAAWLPAAVVGLLYGLGVYRGAAIQGLASIYSPASWHELRGPRRWHVWTGPVVGLIQWLAILASGFGNVVRWRAIDYRLSGGQVIAMRVLAGENRPDEAVTRTGAGAPTRTGCSQPTFQDVAEPVPVFVGPPQPPAVSPSS
jgi:hypothetical protein